jgi:hypothetical protein
MRRLLSTLFLFALLTLMVAVIATISWALTVDSIEYAEDILGVDICGTLTYYLDPAIEIVRIN